MRVQAASGGLSTYGALTLTEAAADAAASGADIFGSPAYQDGIGHGVEITGAVGHGLVALAAGWGALNSSEGEAGRYGLKFATSVVKTTGYSVGAAGAPVVGGMLVAAGTFGDLLTLFMN